MKRRQKRALGLLGLAVVVAATAFAATLPGPEASAVSSVTDTVTVRVVGENLDVSITGPSDGAEFVTPSQVIEYTYEHAKTVTVTLEYTLPDGTTGTKTLANIDADYAAGSGQYPINLEEYGYGDFTVTIQGEDGNGVSHSQSIQFSYYPVTATANQNSENEDLVDVSLNYDPNNDDIDKIIINVYDEDGNLIEGLSPIEVTPPTTNVALDFGKYGLEDGNYTITVTAYDANGNALHDPYSVLVKYSTSATPVPVPDTGSLLRTNNISNTDYLITGLVIFGLIAVAGVMYAMKNGKKNRSKARRR